MRAGSERRAAEARRIRQKNNDCIAGGCKCWCHEPEPERTAEQQRKDLIALWVLIGVFTLLIGSIAGFGMYSSQQARVNAPCYQTVMVDGKECRVIPFCYTHVPIHSCSSYITCNFTGPANGGICPR